MSSIVESPTGSQLAAELDSLLTQIDQLGSVAPTTATVTELAGLLVELETVQNRLAGVAADWTAAFDSAGGPHEHGAPSLNVWCRRELRITAAETRRRARRADTLTALPATRQAMVEGRIGLAHVDQISLGVHQLGADTMAAVEPVLLDVAATCDADAVRVAVRKVRDTLDPDAAEQAYLRALERRDITVTAIGEGFDLRGFLDPESGAAFKTVLDSLSVKTSIADDRTTGQRRCDGLRDLSLSVLEHGLPTDRGLRPHLFVTVEAARLDTATRQFAAAAEAAHLHGFGEISDRLLSRLACNATVTPLTVDQQTGHVLDVGRTTRLATLKQRQAILVQQQGTCLNPGCDRTRLEIHHLTPWSAGGPTDMANLAGYCTRCHHLIHLGTLIIHPDGNGGWRHTTKHRHDLPQQKRRAGHLTRIYLHALTQGGKAHALKTAQAYRQGRGHTVIRT